MNIKIISIASKKTDYESIVSSYLKRFPSKITLQHTKVPIIKRTKTKSIEQIIAAEGDSFLKQINDKDTLIILDQRGSLISSKELSKIKSAYLIFSVMGIWFLILATTSL
jgi:23S rRNA pseudoU1915 N3-methylase RlmH